MQQKQYSSLFDVVVVVVVVAVDKFNISLAPRERDSIKTNRQLKSVIAII